MIKVIDKESCKAIRNELDQQLAELGKRLGVVVAVGSGSYTSTNVSFKINIAVVDASGSAITKEITDFKSYAPIWGLSPDDIGKSVNYAGNQYTIIGAKPRSYKFPILVKRSDGKIFKLPVKAVSSSLGGF